MTIYFIVLIVLGASALWFWKKGIFIIADKKARVSLENMLFKNGTKQKEEILEKMSQITNKKYTQEELLDYFLKIKGLQVVNFYDPVNFWTRKFLMSPTRLKMNYFEQVKFYETFLNYPDAMRPKTAPQNNSKAYITSAPKGVFLKKQLA